MKFALGLALTSLLAAAPAAAIETDQFYAWGHVPQDSTDAVNGWVNLEIRDVLAQAGGEPESCDEVRRRIMRHFRLFLFHRLELWAMNSSLVDRAPDGPDETFRFRSQYLYGNRSALDPARLIPPSPTIRLNGVLVGTDKLTHFTSEGWWYFKWFDKARRRGLEPDEAELKAIRRGVLVEKTILGKAVSGVFSAADLEANYQGMRFWASLCDGEHPMLASTGDGWSLAEPFDFRRYVTPEWDESWQPSILSRGRWKRIRRVLVGLCPMLETPAVRELRRSYARRDGKTRTEQVIDELVEAGKLPDPAGFSIESVCSGSGAAPGG